MVAPPRPPPAAPCFGYGSFTDFSTFVSSSPTSIYLHTTKMHSQYAPSCTTENSISPPSSPCSSHSSLSLEPLTSSPSNSSAGCLNTEPSYQQILSPPSYLDHDIPTLLDTPSNSSTSSLSLSSHHSLKRRLALCQLEDMTCSTGVPASKRLCNDTNMDNVDNAGPPSTDSVSFVSLADHQFSFIAHRNEMLGSIGAAECAGIASGDLDDFLDILLQDAEAMPATTRMAAAAIHEPSTYLRSSGVAWTTDAELAETQFRCPIFACGYEHSIKESNEMADSQAMVGLPPRKVSVLQQHKMEVDALEDFPVRGGDVRSYSLATSDAATWLGLPKGQEQKANVVSSCEEWLRQRPTSMVLPLSAACAAQQEAQQKQSSTSPSSTSRSSNRWAGPTLMDIESALAMTSPPSSTTSTPISFPSAFAKLPKQSSYGLCSIKDILKQETSSFLTTSSSSCKEEPSTLENDDRMATWRRLQKRNQMEPRYTVKIRSEEDAVNDGYRWRKYGQKSIKNSPHPRSYYRCSSGKCNVKKQVERSSEDAGVLVVSYEGIHLHHRPTTTTTTSLIHACAGGSTSAVAAAPAPAPTCDQAAGSSSAAAAAGAPPAPSSSSSSSLPTAAAS